MLAPRKKLWSTPPSVIAAAANLLTPFTAKAVVYDVGCGDGRVLIHLCGKDTTPEGCQFVGVEIDEDRACEARKNISNAGLTNRITVLTENAMLVDFSDATHVFLYLVPRGLRIFKPILLNSWRGEGVLEVVTYMAGFLDEVPVEKITVKVEHQEGAAWPVFLFKFGKSDGGSDEGSDAGGRQAGSSNRPMLLNMCVPMAFVALAWLKRR